MTDLEAACRSSFYKELTQLKPGHRAWLVRHVETGHLFVKKIIPVHNTPIYEDLKAHPVKNMPRIHELFPEGGEMAAIEEYLAGETLEEILSARGQVESGIALDWVRQLCLIVKELHAKEPAVIHRDIKPANIILSPDDVIKLLDVSAAKFESPSETKDTVLMGTHGYAAPEQYGFSASSRETDIYAIGVLLNELVTGHLPQDQKAGGRIGQIVDKCTQLNMRDRYHTVDELVNALPGGSSAQAGRNSVQTGRNFAQIGAPFPQEDPADRKTGWRRYLLPGFRSSNPLTLLLAVTGYALMISMIRDLPLKDAGPGQLFIYRIGVFLMFMLIICLDGNYLGLRDRVPILRNRSWPVLVLLLIGADALIVLMMAFLVASLL